MLGMWRWQAPRECLCFAEQKTAVAYCSKKVPFVSAISVSLGVRPVGEMNDCSLCRRHPIALQFCLQVLVMPLRDGSR